MDSTIAFHKKNHLNTFVSLKEVVEVEETEEDVWVATGENDFEETSSFLWGACCEEPSLLEKGGNSLYEGKDSLAKEGGSPFKGGGEDESTAN